MNKDVIKISKKLKVGTNKIINLYLRSGREDKSIISLVKKGVAPAFQYFNRVKKIEFDIELIYSRQEFDALAGRETADWVSAMSFLRKFIIFAPNVIEKFTTHRKDDFVPVITHETTHILVKSINANFCYWMHEGIAQSIAGQKQESLIQPQNIKYFLRDSLFKNSNYSKFINRQGYQISYRLVNYLMSNYAKTKALKLLAIPYSREGTCAGKWCQILGVAEKELVAQFKKVLMEKRG